MTSAGGLCQRVQRSAPRSGLLQRRGSPSRSERPTGHPRSDEALLGGHSELPRRSEAHTKTYGGKLYLLISGNYRELFQQRIEAGEDKTYCAVQLVTDYIAGMTDGFACRLHQDLMNG